MSYDAVRAQLDKLLGPDRNGPLTSSSKQIEPRYNDSDVCKFYLLGFCPNDLSIKQRSEPGSCPNKHSDLAKNKFETDLKNGKAHEEKVRWTRQLLTQCRSILAAEDRKIRSTARRFQESFQAQGDVTGLMIRSFDTLKALGMVSKDAKVIPYNAKDDNDDIPIDHDPTDNHDSNHDNDKTEFKVKPTSTKDDSDSSADPHSDHQDDDDDLDGFGIIKVISKEGFEQSKEIQLNNTKETNGKSSNQNGNDPKESPNHEDLGDTTSKQKEQATPTNSSTDNKGDSITEEEAKSPDNKDQQGKPSENDTSEDEKTDDNENVPQLKEGTSVEKEDSTNKSIMDKFYEAGIGPDGLLMLDRKRSQRVCACCGGCISLVDAEPRLLSHYGGKAHQSLVLLRQKVDELEELVKSDPQYFESSARRDHYRHSRIDNEYRHSRSYDRGDNSQHAQYGWKPRNKGRRGHGTNDWYQNALRQENVEQDTPKGSEKSFHRDRYDDRHERRDRRYDDSYDNRHYRDSDSRYDDRYGDRDDDRYSDRHRRHGGHSGRHERSRKRYRTPSPSRRHRRSRR